MHPAVRCDHNGCRGYLAIITLRPGAPGAENLARSCTRCRCTVALEDQDELLYAGGGCPLYGDGSTRWRRGCRIKALEG